MRAGLEQLPTTALPSAPVPPVTTTCLPEKSISHSTVMAGLVPAIHVFDCR